MTGDVPDYRSLVNTSPPPSQRAPREADAARTTAGQAVVFSPAPILTVTVESDSDGADELHLHAGGQGFWIARMIRALGVPVTMCSPLGGESGRVLRGLVESEGVVLEGVEVSAPNGAYVHDRRSGKRTRIAEIEGRRLSRHEADDFYTAALSAALSAGLCVFAGQPVQPVIPHDMYRRLARDLRTNACRVVADVSGATLKATLAGGVNLLKVSSAELRRDRMIRSDRRADVRRALSHLARGGADAVVVSRAARPAISRIAGRDFEIRVPKIEPVDFRGAGDSMTAGFAVGLSLNLPPEEVLRLGAAAGSLNVSRHGLGTGRRPDIERLAALLTIRELS